MNDASRYRRWPRTALSRGTRSHGDMGSRLWSVQSVVLLALAVTALLSARWAARAGRDATIPPDARSGVASAPTPHSPLHATVPTFTPSPPARAGAEEAGAVVPTPTLEPNRVGVIPGHWQFDTGAVCADGRREVDVTTDVALRVQALLEYRGFVVDLLPEHDPDVPAAPLQGYRGAALVSIHADSCDVPGASGFKIARGAYSTTPTSDDRLVGCLYEAYGAATGLPRHDGSVTIDMWNYYAFREIGADTPAAIIELGFLMADRAVLDGRRYEMALGIADGISCFLTPEGGA